MKAQIEYRTANASLTDYTEPSIELGGTEPLRTSGFGVFLDDMKAYVSIKVGPDNARKIYEALERGEFLKCEVTRSAYVIANRHKA